MTLRVFSDTVCQLGEGAFWHPEREQFFWFDILGKRLLTRENEDERHWDFDDCVSAAGWVDRDTLILADASALWRFDLISGQRDRLVGLEEHTPHTRSNDGRADQYGGFWIGTMGRNAEPGAGAIYRYYRGALRLLVDNVTISNAICYTPDGQHAFYTDTRDGRIMRQPLDGEGWPKGTAQVFLDLSDKPFGPDGAVVDQQGRFWNAQWGAGRVACYDPDGTLIETHDLPTPQVSCPAFGGPDLGTLFVTTAADGLDGDAMAGMTYAVETTAKGQPEHRVIL